MKKNYTLLLMVIMNAVLFAQNNDFTNGAADGGLWSSPGNWSLAAIPTATSIARTSNSAVSFVNQNFTVLSLQNLSGTTTDRFVNSSSGGILTISPTAANGIAIQNVSSTGVKLGLRGKISIQNTTAANFSRITQANSATNTIEFENTSVLILTTPVELAKAAAAPNGANTFFFNGKIEGTANLRLAANTAATFGNSVSNAGYTGELVLLGNTSLIVNTADDVVFYDGLKIQVNGNSSTTLNGANVFNSGITVGGANTFNLNVNKNQNAMTNIIFQGAGIFNIIVNDAVTNLTFANNSALDWSTGTLNITGYKNGVIRFGTDNTGLTADQLSKITGDGVAAGKALALDTNGYLVVAPTLSVSDFEENIINSIAYPTSVSDKIYFKKLQNNVKIIDINGKVAFYKTTVDQSEIEVETLAPGMYFIVFDNTKVEKFLKN